MMLRSCFLFLSIVKILEISCCGSSKQPEDAETISNEDDDFLENLDNATRIKVLRRLRKLNQTVADKRLEIKKLNQSLAGQRLETKKLNQSLADKRLENEKLNQSLAGQRLEIKKLNQSLAGQRLEMEKLRNFSKISEEYTKFQCGVSDGLRSVQRFLYQVQDFKSTDEYKKKYIAISPSRMERKIMTRIIKRVAPTIQFDRVYNNSLHIWRFVKFSTSSLALSLQQRLSSDDYYLTAFAATLQSEYYLCCRYMHTNNIEQIQTPAIRAFMEAKLQGKSVSLCQLLQQQKNHWPLQLQDLAYLNILRQSLKPKDPPINWLYTDTPNNKCKYLVMPQLDPSEGCANLVLLDY
ncbi:uncharacterized protein LOC135843975 [Planococcus citri]|uniref:uncharacterized protein LOC135843975 n=1 Tax=Planococcus citri TaxID=170843 RepID=UPI0031F7CDC4